MGKISVIPGSLRQNGLFCCWKHEDKNGRKTKIPYNPETGNRAQTNNPKTFTNFQNALSVAQGYSGMGFLITDGLFVIDCDHCKSPKGHLTQTAADICAIFDGCYMEWSPSGEGLHIIGSAPGFDFDKTIYWMNNRRLNVEVYLSGVTNRFMTVTGNAFREGGIPEKSAALRTFLDKYMRRDTATPATPVTADPALPDYEVTAKAANARNGDIFRRLWSGDTIGYASASEADFALCGILAFWCGRDIEQMDRLFRDSGLMRDKWDRPQAGTTYGRITLEKAAAEVKNVYRPRRKAAPQGKSKDRFVGRGGVSLWDLRPENNPRYPWADIGSGRLFADYYKSIARFVKDRKTWYAFNGSHWEADTSNTELPKMAKQFCDDLLGYIGKIEDERIRTSYWNYCQKWMKNNFRETMIKEAQSEYPIRIDEFDTNPYAFNCENGTLFLDSMEFRPHDCADFITKMAKVRYDPDARCERWDQFVGEVMVYDKTTDADTVTAEFLQSALGYALSGETRYECMFILYGKSTRNGKGTLCESVMRIMGDYGRSVKPETLAQKLNAMGNTANEDIARLNGVRFANISEPDKRLELNAATGKTMTGNDSQPARFLYENSFEFYPQFKIFMNTNYRPNIRDMTLFTSNRIYIIPFYRHFDKGEQDITLKDEFRKPENQSGILNWLIAGYRLLKERGLEPSPSVNAATDEYAHDSDKIRQFVEDVLIPDPNGEERTSAVFEYYKQWCVQNGQRYESLKNLSQSLSAFLEVKRKRPRDGGNPTTMLLGYSLPRSGSRPEQQTLWDEPL